MEPLFIWEGWRNNTTAAGPIRDENQWPAIWVSVTSGRDRWVILLSAENRN